MAAIRWIGFCLSDVLTRTLVHFYPAAAHSGAPYPARCKLTIFGAGIERDMVVLDGARLQQPDGVRIEQVFPQLAEQTAQKKGLAGLEIEIETTQPRVDLSGSQCIVEFATNFGSVKYRPARVVEQKIAEEKDMAAGASAAVLPQMVLRDAYSVSSLVLINTTEASCDASFDLVPAGGGVEATRIAVPSLLGGEVREVVVGDSFFDRSRPQETSWGLLRSGGVVCARPGVVGYVLARDAGNKRPMSVSAL